MAAIVMAGAMSHLPAATGWPEQALPNEAENFHRAARDLGEEIRRARPDVVVGVANDHLMNVDLENMRVFTINLGSEHRGPGEWFEPWLKVPQFTVPGHSEAAGEICEGMGRAGISVTGVTENFVYDDNYSVPLTLTGLASAEIPLVPIIMNCTMPPVVSSEAAYGAGRTLGRVIRSELPIDLKVALLATGGLSHEPGGPRYLEIDCEFDRWFLGLLERGSHREVVEQVTVDRMEQAGSGGTSELLAWMVVMGAIDECRCSVLAYEAPESWRCGAGVVRWDVAPPTTRDAAEAAEGGTR
jgi:protocatechuate 4,5-dioxygenase beta chain